MSDQSPDREPTPQLPTKRHRWSRPKVQHRPTRQQRRAYATLVAQGKPPPA